ncbi:hypothetical protein L6R49_23935 [Myxococcota bacterium]|nr:hypothetical protein [Myxococcota bacterium]
MAGPAGALAYSLTLGGLRASSDGRGDSAQARALHVDRGMGGVGRAVLDMVVSADGGAPSPGDPVALRLNGGAGDADVFTGEVFSVQARADGLRVVATDGLATLGRTELAKVWDDKTAGGIVKDLISAAGLSPGDVEDGPNLTGYVVLRGPRALRQIERLGALTGCDVWTRGDGKVCFAGPGTPGGAVLAEWGKTLLALQVQATTPRQDGAEVYAEGAAGAQGADKAHWLVADLTPNQGAAKVAAAGQATPGSAGDGPRHSGLGALRAAADAKTAALGQARWLAQRGVLGWVELLGDPKVEPGDTLTVMGLPRQHPASGVFPAAGARIRRVTHRFDLQRGFTTRVVL